MRNIFKIIYYIFIAFIVIIAVLLIVSVFPITGNYKFLVVQSGSMEPTIKMGAILMTKPTKDYKIGDIITFKNPEKEQELVSHRIVDLELKNGKTYYTTKGDANEDPDTGKVAKDEVVGKVLFSVPYLGFAVDFAKRPIGFALIIIVPSVIVIFDEVKNIWQEIKKKKKIKEN